MTGYRCTCGKLAFRDELAARIFLAGVRNSRKNVRREVRAYRCKFGRVHTTSSAR